MHDGGVNDTTLAPALAAIEKAPLDAVPAHAAAKVVRRIVDGEPGRLRVAAFNSAV